MDEFVLAQDVNAWGKWRGRREDQNDVGENDLGGQTAESYRFLNHLDYHLT